jgi:hypothetical protein
MKVFHCACGKEYDSWYWFVEHFVKCPDFKKAVAIQDCELEKVKT